MPTTPEAYAYASTVWSVIGLAIGLGIGHAIREGWLPVRRK